MKHYHSIEFFMMDSWLKCQGGDLTHTRLDIEIGDAEEDLTAWEALNYDYVMTFGLTRKHIHMMQLQKQLMLLRMDLIITEDMFLHNHIEDLEMEINGLVSSTESGNITTTFILLSKWMNQKVAANNTTVKEFFTMLELYGKDGKEN